MKKQTGFTLIEIMISLLIGLIVIGATINIYIATVGSSASIIKSARLNHDLEAVMTLMINDIKRAGYWGGARVEGVNITTNPNPFTAATRNVQIPVNTCILYSYDAGNGTANGAPDGAVQANEYYGFRLESNTIKMRKKGPVVNDAVTECTDSRQGEWEEFIDSNQLRITTLEFSFLPITSASLPATSHCLNLNTGVSTATLATACTGAANGVEQAEKRVVNIRLTGQLKNEAAVTKTLNATVEIRNNRLCVWNSATSTCL